MAGFVGLTPGLCESALLDIALPAFKNAMRGGIVKREHGFLLVLDPRKQYAERPVNVLGIPGVTLFSHLTGKRSEWEHPYDRIAEAKAWQSWKTGLSSSRIQHEAPYLYDYGMTKFGGSAVDESGQLVVAFSGVEEWFDQMFSEMMLAAIKGLCLHEMHKPDGVMADANTTYIGEGH